MEDAAKTVSLFLRTYGPIDELGSFHADTDLSEPEAAKADVLDEFWGLVEDIRAEIQQEVRKDNINMGRADDLVYVMSRAAVSFRFHADN